MEEKKKSFGEWISDVLVGTVQGAFWLLETVPLTAIVVLVSGLASFMEGDGRISMSSNWLMGLAVIMLIDGYFGHRHAERKEQQMVQDPYRWHEEESKKGKGEQ